MKEQISKSLPLKTELHKNQKKKYSCCAVRACPLTCQLSEIKTTLKKDFHIELTNNGQNTFPRIITFVNSRDNFITFQEKEYSFDYDIKPSESFFINISFIFPPDVKKDEYFIIGILDLKEVGQYNGFSICLMVKDVKTKREERTPQISNNEMIIKKELDEYKVKCQNYERIYNEQNEKIIKIEYEKRKLIDDIDNCKREENRLKEKFIKELNTFNNKEAKWNSLEDDYKKKIAQLEKENKDLINQVVKTLSDINEQNIHFHQLTNDYCDIKSEKKDIENELSKLKEVHEKLVNDYDKLQSFYKKIIKENVELKKKLNDKNNHK